MEDNGNTLTASLLKSKSGEFDLESIHTLNLSHMGKYCFVATCSCKLDMCMCIQAHVWACLCVWSLHVNSSLINDS